MIERERAILTGLILLLVVLTLGFYVHRDPRFPGSLTGGVLGISAASLMLIPLVYLLIKRIPPLKRFVTSAISLRTLLAIHIYAGVLAPILGILHSGHKFQSPLGIALTAMMLIVALSGFVGRYLMVQIATGTLDQRKLLSGLRREYDRAADDLVRNPVQAAALRPLSGFFSRLAAPFFVRDASGPAGPAAAGVRALRLSQSMADVEYAIKSHDVAKSAFGRWLSCHIVIAIVLYALLALHVWSAWYFGIRWLA